MKNGVQEDLQLALERRLDFACCFSPDELFLVLLFLVFGFFSNAR